jgi:hypothetical protein
VSFFQIWTAMKAERRTDARTRQLVTRAEDHGYVVPPHWRARRSSVVPGRKRAVPIGSSCLMCCFQDEVLAAGGVGVWRKRVRKRKTAPPMGRLM